MKILVTGSKGFVGKNLKVFLKIKKFNILEFNRGDSDYILYNNLVSCDLICHLAGENRPKDQKLFYKNNTELTKKICDFLIKKKIKKKIIFSSSIRKNPNSHYSKTKIQCEKILLNYKNKTNAQVSILRFPNIFGKWSKPNYNSVVATFCHNILRQKKIKVFDKNEMINLIYIDDAISEISKNFGKKNHKTFPQINKISKIKISKIAEILKDFNKKLISNYVQKFENIFFKNLHSTFISFIPLNIFCFNIKSNKDKRGDFIEFSKSIDEDQISIFSIKKNKERGDHFHNTKVEKFLIFKGKVELIYKNISDNFYFKKKVNSKNLQMFYSIPGWIHKIKNVGNDEVLGIVWSNEVFDKKKPDTFKLNT